MAGFEALIRLDAEVGDRRFARIEIDMGTTSWFDADMCARLGIFSCGQFFPKRHRLDFSVADLGIGVRRNVKEHAGLDLPAHKAIVWATQEHNTTKRGPIPGGLGLKLLSEFINLNGGRLQIVSDAGYWSLEKGHTETALLRLPFPGTVVNVEINTSDTQSYALSSELKESDIF